MNPPVPPLVASLLLAPLLSAPTLAGDPTPPPLPASLRSGIDRTRVYYDEPGDGALWARGASYKMRFDPGGATYFPRFGPRQPHDVPHRLSPDAVSVGGVPLAFARERAAVRAGDRVDIDRGAFVETYALDPYAVEQSFRFPALPRAGDLVVRIPVASELEGREGADGIEFRGEHGSVRYSRAVAVDARGREIAASTRIEDGSIVIRVAAERLAAAALPLLIDPVVTDVWLDSTTEDDRKPDVAWDPGEGVWLAVYNDLFSATDADVFARMVSASGLLLNGAFIDQTTASWASPRVADLASAHQFLVVAEITRVTPHYVRGRTAEPNGTLLTLGPQFDVTPQGCSGCSAQIRPDVGGDSSDDPGSTYCVVFQENFPSPVNENEIAFRRVTRAGTVVGSGSTYLAVGNGGTQPTSFPSISKSNRGGDWLVTWQRDDPTLHADVLARYVHPDGTTSVGFGVTEESTAVDIRPCASSPQDGSGRAMISFTRAGTGTSGYDVMLAALDGTSVLAIQNLSLVQDPSDTVDQRDSSIDSDGRHFVVAYSEEDPAFTNYDAFVSDVYVSGSGIGISQPHVLLNHLGLWERNNRISAQHLPSGHSGRYFSVYDIRQNTADYDVGGQLFDAVGGGLITTSCYGVGCPCANDDPAAGCATSTGSGATLAGAGSTSVAADDLVLLATGVPPNNQGLCYMGDTQVMSLFYDGFQCALGNTFRFLDSIQSSGAAGTMTYTGVVANSGLITAGTTWHFHFWFRDSPGSPCGSGANLTNLLSVTFTP